LNLRDWVSFLLRVAPLALIVWLAPERCLGQDSQSAAEALFRQGRELMDRGELEAACRKFADSQRIEPGVGTLMNLALCYKQAGKTASAWSTYVTAAAAARDEGQAAREVTAREEARALESQLMYATVRVQGDARVPGLELSVDGDELLESTWNERVPFNPGTHVLLAAAPGYEAREIPIEINAPHTNIIVPRLRAAPSTASPAPPGVPEAPAPQESAPPVSDGETHEGTWSTTHTTVSIVGGVGVAALLVGGALAYSANEKYDNANCDGDNFCSKGGLEARHDAENRANLATVAVGVGLAAVTTAVVVWVWGQQSAAEAASSDLSLAADLAHDGGGVRLSGSF